MEQIFRGFHFNAVLIKFSLEQIPNKNVIEKILNQPGKRNGLVSSVGDLRFKAMREY